MGMLPRGRAYHWVLHPKGFYFSLAGGESQGRSLGRVSIDYSPAFQVCSLRLVVSEGQGVIL